MVEELLPFPVDDSILYPEKDEYLNFPIEMPLFNQELIFSDVIDGKTGNAYCNKMEFFDIRLVERIDNGE